LKTLRNLPNSHSEATLLIFKKSVLTLQAQSPKAAIQALKLHLLLCEQGFGTYYEQLDSHDLFLWLMDTLTTKLGAMSRSQTHLGLKALITEEQELKLPRKLNPFTGVYTTSIHCFRCQTERFAHQLEYSLSLPLPSANSASSVQLPTLVREHFTSEFISDYRCLHCSVQHSLNKAPPSVTVWLEQMLDKAKRMDEDQFLDAFRQWDGNKGYDI
jgi:hypothetical protein